MIIITEGFIQVQIILFIIFFNEFAQEMIFQDLFNIPESINGRQNSDYFIQIYEILVSSILYHSPAPRLQFLSICEFIDKEFKNIDPET